MVKIEDILDDPSESFQISLKAKSNEPPDGNAPAKTLLQDNSSPHKSEGSKLSDPTVNHDRDSDTDWQRGMRTKVEPELAEQNGANNLASGAAEVCRRQQDGNGSIDDEHIAVEAASLLGSLDVTGDGDDDVFEDALTEEEILKRAIAEAEQVKAEGNALYGIKNYRGALERYSKALELLPDHEDGKHACATYHANSAICHLQLGENEEAVKSCNAALELKPDHVKALMRRAQAQEQLDHQEEALADLKKIVELDPGNKAAIASVRRLEPIVAEKREKLKEEMMGKLKDLGNSLLGHFGMSVDNFKAVKDPATGSYSINFSQ